MRHKKDIRKFSRNKSHRKSLLKNMAISFIQNKRIITTEAKAKQLKRVVEKLITTGKTKDLEIAIKSKDGSLSISDKMTLNEFIG